MVADVLNHESATAYRNIFRTELIGKSRRNHSGSKMNTKSLLSMYRSKPLGRQESIASFCRNLIWRNTLFQYCSSVLCDFKRPERNAKVSCLWVSKSNLRSIFEIFVKILDHKSSYASVYRHRHVLCSYSPKYIAELLASCSFQMLPCVISHPSALKLNLQIYFRVHFPDTSHTFFIFKYSGLIASWNNGMALRIHSIAQINFCSSDPVVGVSISIDLPNLLGSSLIPSGYISSHTIVRMPYRVQIW